MSTICAGQPALSDKAKKLTRDFSSGEMTSMIEKLLEQYINPAIPSHGGWVRLVKVEEGNVFLQMSGGCQGCASSKATLQFGIEEAIRKVCPQVGEIIDVTDHTSGDNPYYR